MRLGGHSATDERGTALRQRVNTAVDVVGFEHAVSVDPNEHGAPRFAQRNVEPRGLDPARIVEHA